MSLYAFACMLQALLDSGGVKLTAQDIVNAIKVAHERQSTEDFDYLWCLRERAQIRAKS